MLAKRIIPCLDVSGGRTVKGQNFVGLQDVGDPVELARGYSEQSADEIVFLDITATTESRQTLLTMVEKVARELTIPFTVGGGVRTLLDAKQLLDRGADKIAINSAALANPALIGEIARVYGSQCVVVAVDYAKIGEEQNVFSRGGSTVTGWTLDAWCRRAEEEGAGELLLTSIDADGTKTGFDCRGINQISRSRRIPVIGSGGAGCAKDFVEVFRQGEADAALAAGIFHRGEVSIGEVKQTLTEANIIVRK